MTKAKDILKKQQKRNVLARLGKTNNPTMDNWGETYHMSDDLIPEATPPEVTPKPKAKKKTKKKK